ncbi:MAG: hypothetical protein HOP02_16840 [Methylococcaceae bacterium]|nr:hypothetical protein [Methylococcaceae bacterium]
MNNYILTKLMLAGLVALFALPIQASVISITPSTSTVNVGQSFSLNVNVSEISDLYAFQFDLGYDPSVISATSISEGGFLSTGGSTLFIGGTIDNANGTISNTSDLLNGAIPGVTGSGILATIDFTALTAGSSGVSFFNPILLDSNGADIIANYSESTIVNVSAIPVPAAIWLLGSALMGLVGFSRRQHLAQFR